MKAIATVIGARPRFVHAAVGSRGHDAGLHGKGNAAETITARFLV